MGRAHQDRYTYLFVGVAAFGVTFNFHCSADLMAESEFAFYNIEEGGWMGSWVRVRNQSSTKRLHGYLCDGLTAGVYCHHQCSNDGAA